MSRSNLATLAVPAASKVKVKPCILPSGGSRLTSPGCASAIAPANLSTGAPSVQTATQSSLRAAQLARVLEELLSYDEQMPVIQGLMFLYVAAHSHEGEGPTGLDISTALHVQPPRVSRNLALLEDAELIERHKGHQGAKHARVTRKGQQLLERLTGLIQ